MLYKAQCPIFVVRALYKNIYKWERVLQLKVPRCWRNTVVKQIWNSTSVLFSTIVHHVSVPHIISSPFRWELCVQFNWSVQKIGLHQERQPQLVSDGQSLGHKPPWPAVPEQHQGWRRREQGNQGLHPSEACDSGAKWSEAPESCEDPAEQEDGPFLWTGPDWHHRGHQAGLRSGEEDLHPGGETGERRLLLSIMLKFIASELVVLKDCGHGSWLMSFDVVLKCIESVRVCFNDFSMKAVLSSFMAKLAVLTCEAITLWSHLI